MPIGSVFFVSAEAVREAYVVAMANAKARFEDPYDPAEQKGQGEFLIKSMLWSAQKAIPSEPFVYRMLEEGASWGSETEYLQALQSGAGFMAIPLKERVGVGAQLPIGPVPVKLQLIWDDETEPIFLLLTATEYPPANEVGAGNEMEYELYLDELSPDITALRDKLWAELGRVVSKIRLEVIADADTRECKRVELSLTGSGKTINLAIPYGQLGQTGLEHAVNAMYLLNSLSQEPDSSTPPLIGRTAMMAELNALLESSQFVRYEILEEQTTGTKDYPTLSIGALPISLGFDFTVTEGRRLLLQRGVFSNTESYGRAYTTERYLADRYIDQSGMDLMKLVENSIGQVWNVANDPFEVAYQVFEAGLYDLLDLLASTAEDEIQGGMLFVVTPGTSIYPLEASPRGTARLEDSNTTRDLVGATDAVTVTAVAWTPKEGGRGSGFVVGGTYELSPYGVVISPAATLVLTYTDEALGDVDENQLGMYRWTPDSSNWLPLDVEADLARNVFTATVNQLGTYALGYGGAPTEIQIFSPSDGSTITDTLPVIEASVTNDGVGVDPGSVEMRLDGEVVASVFITSTGQLIYVPTMPIIGGTHVVTVSAADVLGNPASAQATFYLVYRPVGLTIAGPTSGLMTEGLTFSATVDPVSTNRPITYTWQATDLGTITATNGPTNTQVLTWTLAGTKTITVTADNGYGSISNTHVVTISEPVQAGFIAVPTSGASPLIVAFTDTSTGPSTAWAWDFGDGGMSDQQNPVHTFAAAGTYTVTLTVIGLPNSDRATALITVEEAIAGLAAASDSPTALGDSTAFTATVTSGSSVSYTWAFGDDESGSGSTIAHSYATPGIYTAVATVSNSVSTVTATVPVTVDGQAPTSLIVDPVAGQVISQSTYLIEGSASDDLAGVARVEVSLDGGATWHLATGTTAWRYEWVLPAENDVEHLLLSRAVDAAGSVEAAGEGVLVTVDTQAPAITIMTPTANALLTGTTALISGTTSDPASDRAGMLPLAIARVEVSTDGGAIWRQATGITTWSYEWTLPAENGVAHTLLARVVDTVGHTSSTPVVVTVDTVVPVVSAISPADATTDVGAAASLIITFTEQIDPASLHLTVMPDPGGWQFSWNAAATVVTASHYPFAGSTLYTATVTARDLAGHSLASPPAWSFSTAGSTADLSVAQSDSPDPVLPDQDVIYTIIVTNAGPGNATGVVLTDTLPAGFTSISASSPGCNATGTTVVCQLGDLPAGQEIIVTITADAGEPGTFTNQVQATSATEDGNLANNESAETTTVRYNEVYLPLVIRR